VDRSLFDERDLAEITSPDFPGERLVVCRNPLLADERARKREALLEATEKRLDKIVAATRREKRPLRGKGTIGLRVGKVIDKRKVGKHFILTIEDDRFEYRRDEAKIAAEAALDGIYVVRTSVDAESMPAENAVATYKSLSTVERAFRSLKTVDLKVRPIYHRVADRVRAHIFLCMLAYYVEWHMRRRRCSSTTTIAGKRRRNAAAWWLRPSVPTPHAPRIGRSARPTASRCIVFAPCSPTWPH
jgi:hypothetical protein